MGKTFAHIPLGDTESFIGIPAPPPRLPPPNLWNSFAEGIGTKKHPAFSSGTENKYTGNTPWALAEYKEVIQQTNCSLNENRKPELNWALGMVAVAGGGGGAEGLQGGFREKKEERENLHCLTIFPFCKVSYSNYLNTVVDERITGKRIWIAEQSCTTGRKQFSKMKSKSLYILLENLKQGWTNRYNITGSKPPNSSIPGKEGRCWVWSQPVLSWEILS